MINFIVSLFAPWKFVYSDGYNSYYINRRNKKRIYIPAGEGTYISPHYRWLKGDKYD